MASSELEYLTAARMRELLVSCKVGAVELLDHFRDARSATHDSLHRNCKSDGGSDA